MDTSFAASIEAYRTAAAKRFLEASEATNSSTTDLLNDQTLPGQHAAYQRPRIPGLEEYLHNAADAYAHAKARVKPNPKQRCFVEALGHGVPVELLHATPRREKWLRLQAERKHFVRVTQQSPTTDFVALCGIPGDVLQRAASRYLLHKKMRRRTAPKSVSEHMLGKRLVNESTPLLGIRTDPGFSIHIKHCEDVLAAGGDVSVARCRKTRVTCDNFEDVRKRYAGRPDELYRRKTARRYATWRRKREEEERILRERELDAEREMKRRRGHDQLLTSRPNGDSSFAPFLYELADNTYAYSSKITKAPKLRQVMVDKYSAQNNPEPNQFHKAQGAEANSLFHNRVMNRFS